MKIAVVGSRGITVEDLSDYISKDDEIVCDLGSVDIIINLSKHRLQKSLPLSGKGDRVSGG